MASKPFVMDLAKLVIAAAWADGELAQHEVNALKELLFLVPDMTGQDWLELELYMDHPVTPVERDRLLAQVLAQVRSARRRTLVLETLAEILQTDAAGSPEQTALVEDIRRDVEQTSTGLTAHLTKAVRAAVSRLDQEGSESGREARLDDFVKNRVYYRLIATLDARETRLELPDDHVRKLCLAAGLMARVAWEDGTASEEETRAMVRVLHETWSVSEPDARRVTDVGLETVRGGLDVARTTRNLFGRTSYQERRAFVRSLFAVANAAHKTSSAEIKTIQTIAKGLKLTHREFIDAKLTIPREDRRGL